MIIIIIIIIISIIIIHILTILSNNCQTIFSFFRIVKNTTLLKLFLDLPNGPRQVGWILKVNDVY
jgi:hypothetical protein